MVSLTAFAAATAESLVFTRAVYFTRFRITDKTEGGDEASEISATR